VSFASAVSPSYSSQNANTNLTSQAQASYSAITPSQESRLPEWGSSVASRGSGGDSSEILPPNRLPVIITYESPTDTVSGGVNISKTSPLASGTAVAIYHSHSYISPAVGQNAAAASASAPQATETSIGACSSSLPLANIQGCPSQILYPSCSPSSGDPAASLSGAVLTAPVPSQINPPSGFINNLSTQGPGRVSSVWEKTVNITNKKLLEHSLPLLAPQNLTSNSATENLQSILKDLDTAKTDVQKRRWRYVWDGKEVIVVERWGKVLKSVEKYAKVVDTTIQYHPDITALVWACARTILRVRKIIYPPV